MSGPSGAGAPPRTSGLRAVAAPETLGIIVAIVLLVGSALTGALPTIGGTSPDASATPSPSTSAAPSSGGLASTTRNALVAALAVNQRLAGRVEPLQEAIDGEDQTGATIAAIVRAMNQDITAGQPAAERIARDPATATLGAELGTFYADLARRNKETLATSYQEGAAYRAAAVELIAILGALPAFDDRIADALAGRGSPSGSPDASLPAGSPGASPSAVSSPSASAPPSATASGSAVPSASPAGPSLIRNGTFDTDLAGWTLEVDPGARADATHDPAAGRDGSGTARISIVSGSAARAGITFVSAPFQLETGRRYTVTAAVRSTSAREVRLRIAAADGNTTTARTFLVGATWTTLSFEMTELTAGSASVFALDAGRSEAPIWLDDVAVVAVGQ